MTLLNKLVIFSFFSTITINAQVGIGTSNPRGALDVNNSSQGVILSKVPLLVTTQQSPVVNPAGGNLEVGTLVYNTNTLNDVVPGFYYWDGIKWIPLKSDGASTENPSTGDDSTKWDLNGNSITTSNFIGTTNSAPLIFRTNNARRMTLLETGELVIRDFGLTSTHPAYLTVTSADTKHSLFSLSTGAGSAVYGRKTGGTTGNAIVGETSASSGNASIAAVFKGGGATSWHYSTLTGISVAGLNYGVSSRFFGSSGIKAGYHSQYGTTNNWYFGGRNGTTAFVTQRLATANQGFLFSSLGPGAISTVVSGKKEQKVTMHAVVAPEHKITDYGSGTLTNGHSTIIFDEQLKNVIDITTDEDLKIFIQLEGDCNGVYVTNKSLSGFEVKELNQGKSNVKFSYTIVAKRKNEVYNNDNEQQVSDYSGRFIPLSVNK